MEEQGRLTISFQCVFVCLFLLVFCLFFLFSLFFLLFVSFIPRCCHSQRNHSQIFHFQLFLLFLVRFVAFARETCLSRSHSLLALDRDEPLYASQNDRGTLFVSFRVGQRDRECVKAHAISLRSQSNVQKRAHKHSAEGFGRANSRQTPIKTSRIVLSRHRLAVEEAPRFVAVGRRSGDGNRGKRRVVSLRRIADFVLFRGKIGISVSPIESVDVFASVAPKRQFVLSKSPIVCVRLTKLAHIQRNQFDFAAQCVFGRRSFAPIAFHTSLLRFFLHFFPQLLQLSSRCRHSTHSLSLPSHLSASKRLPSSLRFSALCAFESLETKPKRFRFAQFSLLIVDLREFSDAVDALPASEFRKALKAFVVKGEGSEPTRFLHEGKRSLRDFVDLAAKEKECGIERAVSAVLNQEIESGFVNVKWSELVALNETQKQFVLFILQMEAALHSFVEVQIEREIDNELDSGPLEEKTFGIIEDVISILYSLSANPKRRKEIDRLLKQCYCTI